MVYYQQRNQWGNRNPYQKRNYQENLGTYPEKMKDRLGYREKPKMRNILQNIKDDNTLNLALTLIKQIRENDRNHRIAKLEDGKLFRKHQDYIKKVVETMQIRKELLIYRTLLLRMVGWLFGMIEQETRKDAETKANEIEPIQTTLNNLWIETKDSTIYRIFEVHQFEMRITRRELCQRLAIDERMFTPPQRNTQRNYQVGYQKDDTDYRKQLLEDPALQETIRKAAATDNLQEILLVAQGMEASSNLGAPHLGLHNKNTNPVTSVQVDSVAARDEMIGNEITTIRMEMETSDTPPEDGTPALSQQIGSTRGNILETTPNPGDIEIRSKRNRSPGGNTSEPKRSNIDDTPAVTAITKAVKFSKSLPPLENSQYYREYAPHLKFKAKEIPLEKYRSCNVEMSYMEEDPETGEIGEFWQPANKIIVQGAQTNDYLCAACKFREKERNKVYNHIISHHYPKNPKSNQKNQGNSKN